MKLQTPGANKYPGSVLLKSSAGLGWSTLSADLRSHGIYETPAHVPQSVELCLTILGNDQGLVIRTGAGQRQEAVPVTGAIWLTPIGIGKTQMVNTAPIPETLHMYLPTTQFRQLSDDFNLPGMAAHSIRYAAGVRDDLIEQIGRTVVSEMTAETSAGRMLVETASMMLVARLIHSYREGGTGSPGSPAGHKLDHARLRRVLDHILAHLGDDITLAELAKVAGVSLYHFAHMFTLAVGVSPHRYISGLRLERAMADIAADKLPLAQIAFDARFSSQASFTRAFRRATGVSPGKYRRGRRLVALDPLGLVASPDDLVIAK
jgi:AraC family transcriptional regulator